jgi:sulfane dehydrogenase subunit SoxC
LTAPSDLKRVYQACIARCERLAITFAVGAHPLDFFAVSTLLDEAGIEPIAKWILAEGADAAGMSRSIPLAKAMDDALIALFQNGERIRPSNGYPIRLLLPGYEGKDIVECARAFHSQ